MRKQYASSVYSQKSATSAKSGRSYLSLSTPIWPLQAKKSIDDKPTLWKSLKSWVPSSAKKSDNDSMTTTQSNSSSISKLKRLFYSKKKGEDSVPRLSFDDEEESGSSTTLSLTTTIKPMGILINRGQDSAEAIEERKKRRQSRRENIRKLQHHRNSGNTTRMVGFAASYHDDDEEDQVQQEDDDYFNPRIMFIENSPVPRFRNKPPPPPASPAYIHILTQQVDDTIDNTQSIIVSPTMDKLEPTVYTTPHTTSIEPIYHLQAEEKPRLYFTCPFFRGQTLKFSLENSIPEDHIILFKFLTSNNTYGGERYFVRPSAGKMDRETTQIMLFLNQMPPHNIRKDKIMIRYAVIQRNTKLETWCQNLTEATRRKWIDMLDEQWPDQATITTTKIRIKYLY